MGMFDWLKSNISKKEVIEIIEDFLGDSGGAYDWGEFLCISIKDPFLDQIRETCNELSNRYPPKKKGEFCNEEGIKELKKILKSLQLEN